MDTRKIENIILIILVILNVFLLAVVVSDHARSRRSDRETEDTITALLADSGIAVSESAVLVQETPAAYTVARDFAREEAQMKAMLGPVSVEDLGGSILFYRSEKGQVVQRGTGEMDMLLTGGSVSVKGGTVNTAQRFFSEAEIDLQLLQSGDDAERADFCCLWNGLPVYNARLSFDFSGDSLFMVTGTMLFTQETERSDEGVMDAVSALMRFLEIVRSEGFICSRLEGLMPGYLMNVTVSGESTLTPVWHIETDTGELFINALSGKQETIGDVNAVSHPADKK